MAPTEWIAAKQFDRIRDESRARGRRRARQAAGGERMTRVVTFGEVMLRLKSPGFERLFQSPMLEATFGGAEANVAASLAQFGVDARFVSAIPANNVGDSCVATLKSFGVDTSMIRRQGERLGDLLPRERREPASVARHLRSRGLVDLDREGRATSTSTRSSTAPTGFTSAA